jgi:ribonucleoside-diphosphate reductase alpha chain
MKGVKILQSEETLKSFNNDKLASDVFLSKYALRDDNGNVLETTLKQTKERLNKGIKEVDGKGTDFMDLLDEYFMPAGRIIYALGNPFDKVSSMSNCYVIESPEDNIESIFLASSRQARIFSKGGGVGMDLSKLRPKGAKVNNSAKSTSGAVSFMDLFSMVTGLIAQMGRRKQAR